MHRGFNSLDSYYNPDFQGKVNPLKWSEQHAPFKLFGNDTHLYFFDGYVRGHCGTVSGKMRDFKDLANAESHQITSEQLIHCYARAVKYTRIPDREALNFSHKLICYALQRYPDFPSFRESPDAHLHMILLVTVQSIQPITFSTKGAILTQEQFKEAVFAHVWENNITGNSKSSPQQLVQLTSMGESR